MDKKLRQISAEIQRGNSLEINIPVLFNSIADQYQSLAQVRLAMHYFTFYEAYYDDEDTWNKEALTLIHKTNQIISENVLHTKSGQEHEKAIHEIDCIRNEIMKRMNVLTTYTDIFQNYEYVLNRLEYRFFGEANTIDETEFAKDILRFIFDTEDNLIINEKIKEMISQLPIRFTKQKYFEILKESLGAYLGTEGASFNTFLYMLRTSAMLDNGEDSASSLEELYPDLWDRKEYLAHIEYQNITKDKYEKAVSMLKAATLTLETESSIYFGLQEIINEVYTLLLCSPYSGMSGSIDDEVQNTAVSIINDINEIFLLEDKIELSDELVDRLTDLEGVQEELDVEINTSENALYIINESHRALTESLMLDQVFHVLMRSQSLMSNSLFINLDEVAQDTIVDEDRIKREQEALENELTQLFAGQDRMLSRAVIANTINKVPVFFKNHKEVMDYVRYSLERCSDIFEKAACYEIINEIMAE